MHKDNREKSKGMFVVDKNVGETPLEVINRFKEDNKKEYPELEFLPVTYAGRLDPMAEGLLVLLVGNEVKNKEKYLELSKTYEFEVLWGVETDSLDLLGLIVESSKSKVESKIPDKEEIYKYLENSKGKFEQMYPVYSSRPVGGKPLFEWARQGKIGDIEIPKHVVEVYSAKHLGRREVGSQDLEKEILRKIDLVRGDFRQEEIKNGWKEALAGKKENFVVDKFEASVSSGFYVRQFVSDMGRSMNCLANTYSIKRIKVGDFTLANF